MTLHYLWSLITKNMPIIAFVLFGILIITIVTRQMCKEDKEDKYKDDFDITKNYKD